MEQSVAVARLGTKIHFYLENADVAAHMNKEMAYDEKKLFSGDPVCYEIPRRH